jgi:hypothetical protein
MNNEEIVKQQMGYRGEDEPIDITAELEELRSMTGEIKQRIIALQSRCDLAERRRDQYMRTANKAITELEILKEKTGG